jgi:hypothetical protein
MFKGTDNAFLNEMRRRTTSPMNDPLAKEHIMSDPNPNRELLSEEEIQNANKEFYNSFVITEDEATSIMNSSNIFTPQQIHDNRYNMFSRYGLLDPYNQHTSSREYLFFTKPDLHIFETTENFKLYEPLSNVPFFQSAASQFPDALLSLQQTFSSYEATNYPNKFKVKNKYIPLLSNHVSSTLDFPAINATETSNNSNLYQISTSYRDGSEISDCAFDFTLEFTDTKYLDVYMFFKAYDSFIRQEYRKEIKPTKDDYTLSKVNWKQFSVYKIIVDDTNTIIFYGKATAVQPMGVPRDAMSNFDGSIKITVPFKGQFIDDLDPITLKQINHLTALSLGKTDEEIKSYASTHYIPLYDQNKNTANTSWAAYPYVIKKGKKTSAGNSEGELYKLIWLY